MGKSNPSYLAKIAVTLIRGYQQAISPLFPPSCRFYPTCSNYTIEAFQTYGFFRGFLMSVWRILRCNPLSKGGYDPVTPAKGSMERNV
ncbi:MAG: membrane protein insertion efficiency factor YidD [Candidatus Kryptoniota bacterium]